MKFFWSYLRNSAQKAVTELQKGFSLVELVVAVSILIILTLTFLFSYSSFDRRVTGDILAHQIAVWIHDAQVSAMSVRRAANEQTRFPGYGLHFDKTTPGKFAYFADIDKDRIYDPIPAGKKCGDAGVECQQEISLLRGNIVASLCGNQPFGAQEATCTSAVPGSDNLYDTNIVDIVFMRPNPFDATIIGSGGTAYSHAEITIASPKNYRHTIIVWTTGQVSVR